MKRVVSVSIGSSERDHRVEIDLLGETFVIERIGTDGSMDKAIALVRELDGKVDAFGMGGIDLYVHSHRKKHAFRDGRKIAAAAIKTPMLDGSGLKNTLERKVIRYLDTELNMVRGKKVLMVCSVDRFGMADAFLEAGAHMTYGDLIFGLGIPVPVMSARAVDFFADFFLPVLTQLPFQMIYPTGGKQDEITPKYGKFYRDADIIAGDLHYIRKYMPDDLSGKTIVTNTVTSKNVKEFADRGVVTLVTTTPELSGRSFGTNVMEATLVALSGKRPDQIKEGDYIELLDRVGFEPRIQQLHRD